MMTTSVDSASIGASPVKALKLTFYIAGSGLHSRQARSNFDNLVAELAAQIPIDTEIIDVTEAPGIALAQGIFATPTLLATLNNTRLRFVGDLSHREKVLQALLAEI